MEVFMIDFIFIFLAFLMGYIVSGLMLCAGSWVTITEVGEKIIIVLKFLYSIFVKLLIAVCLIEGALLLAELLELIRRIIV
jgi:hypothetical protein